MAIDSEITQHIYKARVNLLKQTERTRIYY